MLRRTSHMSIIFFEDGDHYSARADFERFTAIDKQLDLALKLTGGGVIEGWGIVQTSSQLATRNITIKPGIGIVPFVTTKEDPVSGLNISETHFLGVRTKSDIVIANVGANRNNIVYIQLNAQLLAFLQNNPEAIVDLTEDSVDVVIRPNTGTPSGSGPFRTTTASSVGGTTETERNNYPIFFRRIDGDAIDPFNSKIVVSVNGKQMDSGVALSGGSGNVIQFENPLHPQDLVTTRIDPLFGLIIGEIQTGDSSVKSIDNGKKQFANERSGDKELHRRLIEHVHDAIDKSPSKILLTTRTGFIDAITSDDNQTFIFVKPTETFSFDFNDGTYSSEIFINNKLNSDTITQTDEGNQIKVVFGNALNPTDVIRMRLVVNNEYVEVIGKIRSNADNASADKIDFEISGESITEETLSKDVLPRLSHIGINKEALVPGNKPGANREAVHRIETFDYKEFFPVHDQKFNARNAKYLFFDKKNSSARSIIHAAGSNGFLYKVSEEITYSTLPDYNGGWNSFSLDENTSSDLSRRLNEYDAPFKIIPIKNPIATTNNNWDRLFYVGNRFVTQSKFKNSNLTNSLSPTLTEIINLTADINISSNSDSITDIRGNNIDGATGGRSPLNMEKTAFILLDNKVFVYEYLSSASKYHWLDITSSSLWGNNSAKSLSSLRILNNDVLFVGTIEGNLYCNLLTSSTISNGTNAGSNSIDVGNVKFSPSSIWGDNTYSYGYGYGFGIGSNYFDVISSRGTSVGYGAGAFEKDFESLFGYGYGYEEKLPIRNKDNLLLVSKNVSERVEVSSITDTVTFFSDPIINNFPASSEGLSSSFAILDWFEIGSGFDGIPVKVVYAFDRLVLLTKNAVYYSQLLSSISDVYFIEKFSWTRAWSLGDTHNDMTLCGTSLIVASDGGIYRGVWAGGTISWIRSENLTHGNTLNNILYPAYQVQLDPNSTEVTTMYVSGKYGIFKSVDCGVSWRNTIQLLGAPEDRDSFLTLPKIKLRIVGKDEVKNRIYVIQHLFPYGYGYGYGYGIGLDYFDVISFDSSGYGYGVGSFEQDNSFGYGYGLGYEIQDIENLVNNNDWAYFSANSGSAFLDIPVRILEIGTDINDIFYLDIEKMDGSRFDFSKIIDAQTIDIYKNVNPLPIVDGIPQNDAYDSTDILPHIIDYHRQSISFFSRIDEDKEIKIATFYKYFERIGKNISDLDSTKLIFNIDGIEISGTSNVLEFTETQNYIELVQTGNIDDVLRLTAKEVNIADIGIFSHEEIEDSISTEELGIPYRFEGVRTSNFLNTLMAIQHYYPGFKDSNFTYTQYDGTFTSLNADYLEDENAFFGPGMLVGRRLIIDPNNNQFDYTIAKNSSNRIFLLRRKTYEEFNDDVNGVKTDFNFTKGVAVNDVEVFINGSIKNNILDYEYKLNIKGDITGISFIIAPENGSNLNISYVKDVDYINFSNIATLNIPYRILGEEMSPFEKMVNSFVIMHNKSDVIDLEFSFIENNIFFENKELGKTTQHLSFIYYDSTDNNIYAGTNKGIWRRNENVSIYKKTGVLIDTINASGTVSLGDTIGGAFVRYNNVSKEWTATWGLGTISKDNNGNLSKINVKAIAHNPKDTNMVIAAAEDVVYRTEDGGTTWEVIWDLSLDTNLEGLHTPQMIVFDDKNPWNVNLVLSNGLYRSFDYGNNWEIIAKYDVDPSIFDASRSFSYQIDSTDIRGTYYYGENIVQFKNSSNNGSFGSRNPRLSKIQRVNLFGPGLANLKINAIVNRPDDPNQVFIGSDVYGVLKTTQFGNDVHFATEDYKNRYGFISNELQGSLSTPLGNSPAAIEQHKLDNTGAFHFLDNPDNTPVAGVFDIKTIVGAYTHFVDKINNRTYLIARIDGYKHLPVNGEFVGKWIGVKIGLNSIESKQMKIIKHYDRGDSIVSSGIRNRKGETQNGRIVEFVLEGQYPFLYNSNELPTIVDEGVTRRKDVRDYDYYWYGSPFSYNKTTGQGLVMELNNFFVGGQSGVSMPFFTQSNGKIDKIKIKDIKIDGVDNKILAIQTDHFTSPAGKGLNGGSFETTFQIWAATGKLIQIDANWNTEDQFAGMYIGDPQSKIRYKILSSRALVGNDISDILFTDNGIGGIDDLATGGTWTGILFDNARFRIEIDSIGGTDTFRWNNTGVAEFESAQSGILITGMAQSLQDGITITFGATTGHTGNERWNFQAGDVAFNRNKDQLAFRIEKFDDASTLFPTLSTGNLGVLNPIRLWNSDGSNRSGVGKIPASIYESGDIKSLTTTSVTLAQSNLVAGSLVGYSLFPDTNSPVNFGIISNTTNTIVVNGNPSIIGVVNGSVRIGQNIKSERVNDFIIDPSDNDKMFAAAADSPYISTDGGISWRLLGDGLAKNVKNGDSLVKFERLRILASKIYGCSIDKNSTGGIYEANTTIGSFWTKIGNFGSVNDISVFNSSGDTVIYAATLTDGIYKGTNSSGAWIWIRATLPEHNVGSVEIVRKNSGDLDRVWIGTNGRGLFRKNSLTDPLWGRNLKNPFSNTEISSIYWRPWRIFNDNGNINVSAMFSNQISSTFFEYNETTFSPIASPGIGVLSVFDWSRGLSVTNDKKDKANLLLVDQSNSSHISEKFPNSITGTDASEFNKLSNYVTKVKGTGIEENSKSNLYGLEKTLISFISDSVFEEPFNHLPDRMSITDIVTDIFGRVYLSTDRSGVWRSKSATGLNYMMPFDPSPPDLSYEVSNNFGYTFDSSVFFPFYPDNTSSHIQEVRANTGVGGLTSLDPNGTKGIFDHGRFWFKDNLTKTMKASKSEFLYERIYTYDVNSGTTFYNDIQTKIGEGDFVALDLVGGYFIFSTGITESRGIESDSHLMEIVNVVDETSSPENRYVLFFTAGSIKSSSSNATSETWDNLDTVTDSSTYTRFVIVDFESYEKISNGLPTLGVKNSLNEFESAVFVRSMDKRSGQAAIACDIGGVWLSETIENVDGTTVVWFQLTTPGGVHDVTDVIYTSGQTVHIGTWGNGVWSYVGGSWSGSVGNRVFSGGTWSSTGSSTLLHNHIWCLLLDASGVLWAGTEHGGLYKWDGSSLWERQGFESGDQFVRSKLYLWKTEGINPVRVSSVDFSDNSNLLSYAWGGGIMRSTDRGVTWIQVNSGLNNYYVQDISISPDNKDVAYAATCGGGVFKTTNAFSGNCSWTQCSVANLPSTLNIDQVETGSTPGTLYIKARVNDFSFKDLPIEIKRISFEVEPARFEDQKFEKGSYGKNLFSPIHPFTKGSRKAVIYRSVNSGGTWTQVYDKDPNVNLDYSFNSGVFGMTMVPGQSDIIKFLYKFEQFSTNPAISTTNQYLYVTITAGIVTTEISFPLDTYASLSARVQKADVDIAIDPLNTNKVYISTLMEIGKNKTIVPRIYKSIDGGANWTYANSHLTSGTGLNSKIQISAKAPPVLTGFTTSSISSAFTSTGSRTSVTLTTTSAFWPEADQFYANNLDKIVSARFQNTDGDAYSGSLFFTYRDEPVISRQATYPRPFYLTGATLQPNVSDSTTNVITGGGHETFMPATDRSVDDFTNNQQLVTLNVGQSVVAGNQVVISGLTSLRFDWSSVLGTILEKENALIGCDINIGASATDYKVAFHRAIYTSTLDVSPAQIELIIIASLTNTIASGTSITIKLKTPMYSNYDNDLMLSVNEGLSWKRIGKENFSLALSNIKGMTNNSTLASGIERSTFVMVDDEDKSIIYRGDVNDTRYVSGGRLDTTWTEISSVLRSTDTLSDGLAFSQSENIIYISERNRILKMNPSTGSIAVIYSNLEVHVPIIISKFDSLRMAFVANKNVYTSSNGFNGTTDTLNDLPVGLNPIHIEKLVLGSNTSFPEDMFICVDAGQLFDQASSVVASLTSTIDDNIFVIPIPISSFQNPFRDFLGQTITFENSGVSSVFRSNIISASGGVVTVSPTLSSTILSFIYNVITDTTTLTCSGSSINIKKYVDNVISIQILSDDPSSFFTGKIEAIENITIISFDVVVSGDLRQIFTNNNMDFNVRFPFYRVGQVSDFLPTGFSGIIRSSKPSLQMSQNGLWYSKNFGASFSKAGAISIGGDNDLPGCTNVYSFSNGATVPVLLSNIGSRLMVNDNWMPSENFNRVLAISDGNVLAATSNGLAMISNNDTPSFNNFFTNNFTQVLQIGTDQFYVFDANGNTFLLNDIPTAFIGEKSLTATNFEFPNVNKALKDNNGVIWIATEGSGLFATWDNVVFNFTTNNSGLGGNVVRDIYQDSRGNLWVCLGDEGLSTGSYGNNKNDIPIITWNNITTGSGEISVFGLSGEINTINERKTLDMLTDGVVTTANPNPKITARWGNSSIVFSNTLITRSRSSVIPPTQNGTSYTFNPISDTVLSVNKITSGGSSFWRIQISTNFLFDTDFLVGKYIVPASRNNDTSYFIIGNSLDTVDIEKVNDIIPATIGDNMMIVEKIEDAFIIYSGDGNDINFSKEDIEVVNGSTYWYHMFFFNPNTLTYVLVDAKEAVLSSTTQISNVNLDLVVGGKDGIFQYLPTDGQKFSLISSFGSNVVSDIFFDSSNVGWIAAGEKLIEFSSPNITTEYDKNILFPGKSSLIPGTLKINNATERVDGDVVISTNLGISIKSGVIFNGFVANDTERVYRDLTGNLLMNNWRTTKVLSKGIQSSIFLEGENGSSALFIAGKDIVKTQDTGSEWTLSNIDENNQLNSDIEFAHEVKFGNNIIDYMMASNGEILSTSANNINNIILENIPPKSSSTTNQVSPGNMWLSEVAVGNSILLVGLFNNNVVLDEKEISRITFTAADEFTTLGYARGSDGLSIQSVYSLAEIFTSEGTELCAGCKDSIISKTTSDVNDRWGILVTNEFENKNYVYSSLSPRRDENPTAPFKTIEQGETLYALRGSIWGNRTIKEVLSLRFQSGSSNKVQKYNISGSLESGLLFSSPTDGFLSISPIKKVDRVGLSSYVPQSMPLNTYKGHMGSVKFLDQNRTLAVGGFGNSLMVIPFTSEIISDTKKSTSGVLSGLRGHINDSGFLRSGYKVGYKGFQFPIETNESSFLSLFSSGQEIKTEANFIVKPKSAWSIKFVQDEGYSSFFYYGQNTNNKNKKFNYQTENNVAYLMKTRTGGMFWAPVGYSNLNPIPTASITDYAFDPNNTENLAISAYSGIFGTLTNRPGAYRSLDGGNTWSSINSGLPVVPSRSIETIGSNIYIGMMGYGVHVDATTNVFGTSSWTPFLSRYVTQKGINLGRWKINSIDEDKENSSRILIGTDGQGILESNDSGSSWSFDDDGMQFENINILKILPKNPSVVLAGPKNQGMFRKDSNNTTYTKLVTGLPTNANVRDIGVDTEFSETFTRVIHSNITLDNIIILRASFEPPSSPPTNQVVYEVGNEIANARVVFLGAQDFGTNPFKDTGSNIRSGIPYYYRFYTLLSGVYSERSTTTGFSTTVEPLKLTDTSATFVPNSLAGRIMSPNTLIGNPQFFEIDSNTATTLTLKADEFQLINRGDATREGLIVGGESYEVFSTQKIETITINPIYAAIENTSSLNSDIYLSTDNGLAWNNVSGSGISSRDVNSISIEQLNTAKNVALQNTTMYAATASGVHKTSNSGSSWTELSSSTGPNNLPSGISYVSVLNDREDCRIIYAITVTGLVYRTINGGSVWQQIFDIESNVNESNILSFFTDYVYAGTLTQGLQRIDDSIRDKVHVFIQADGKITTFDIDFLEQGDVVDTGVNQITATTLAKNDTVLANKEQVRFTVEDIATIINFSFKKNGGVFNIEDIFIGDQLVNPPSNPFTLRTQTDIDDPTIINEMTRLDDGKIYAATNRGVYSTSNSGDKWQKLNSAVLPSDVFDISFVRNGEIALATQNGLWVSSNEQKSYGLVESTGNAVNAVWESTISGGTRLLFRGGDEGLKITIDNSSNLIVFSGTLGGGPEIKFSWGDLFDRTDGGWSSSSIREQSEPFFLPTTTTSTALKKFDGWDRALIVRNGPFSTYDKARIAAENDNIFIPAQEVSYPSMLTNETSYLGGSNVSPVFEAPESSKASTEEILDLNLKGRGAVGNRLVPPRFISDGSIIIGEIFNRKRFGSLPKSFETDPGPTTDSPIIDRVQPLSSLSRVGVNKENFADVDAYSSSSDTFFKTPAIISNRFYLYRAFPYLFVPEPLATADTTGVFPVLPLYVPSQGDIPESYSYSIDINKFGGASTILSGTTVNDNNWVVGTDAGVFYSSFSGRDVNQTNDQGIIGNNFIVPAVIFTSSGIAIAAVISSTTIYLAKSTVLPLGKDWSIISQTATIFSNAGVRRINNFTEDSSGNIYASTNQGVFKGDANGNDWQLVGQVGNLESVSSNRVLGQEFQI